MQSHDNDDIYNKVVKIISEYFEGEEEDDGNVAPQIEGNQFQFGAQQQPGGGGQFNF